MDVYCAKCGEPWDTESLRIRKETCEECNGDGRVPLEPEEFAEGWDSMLLQSDEVDQCAYCEGKKRLSLEMALKAPCFEAADVDDMERKVGLVFHARRFPRAVWLPVQPPVWYLPTKQVPCPECEGSGYVERKTVCEECSNEIEPGFTSDSLVVSDGCTLLCYTCALKQSLVVQDTACPECSGTGKAEVGGDMEPDEIRRFRRGEGCPCCDFGEDLLPESAEIREARLLKAARSAVEASDEEPMGILARYGVV